MADNKGTDIKAEPVPINEKGSDATWADTKMAISFGIVLGLGIVFGWYLSVSGFFG